MSNEHQTNAAYSNYIRFFSGEKNVPILHHAYLSDPQKAKSVSGYQKWDNLVQNRLEYYPFSEEREILRQFRDDIKNIVGEEVHISSLGTGTKYSEQEKTIPIMSAFSKVLSYTALDTSQEALIGAASAVSDAFPNHNFPVRLVNANMFDKLEMEGQPHLSMLFGCTIANFENAGQSQIKSLSTNLTAVLNNLPSNGYMLVGYDRNMDRDSLIEAYDNEEMHDLMLTSLHAISWSQGIKGFDPEKFRCVIKWEPDIRSIEFYAQPTKKQTFSVNNYQITLDKTKLMHIGNSAKISETNMREAIRQVANQNQIELTRHYELGTNRMAVALIHKP